VPTGLKFGGDGVEGCHNGDHVGLFRDFSQEKIFDEFLTKWKQKLLVLFLLPSTKLLFLVSRSNAKPSTYGYPAPLEEKKKEDKEKVS
jgi:hypothetical protein